MKYTFDDLLIVPTYYSEVYSRSECNTSVILPNKIILDIPLISASMAYLDTNEDGSLNSNFLREVRNSGSLHIISRGNSKTKFVQRLEELKIEIESTGNLEYGLAVGLEDLKTSELFEFVKIEGLKLVLSVDIAHGALIKNEDISLYKDFDNVFVVVGNFANPKVLTRQEFMRCGVKIGIGGGSGCTTRITTGVGYPQASLIQDTRDFSLYQFIISDGGIEKPADFCKAVALGADIVMAGSIFSRAIEAPVEREFTYGAKVVQKTYGQASSQIKGTSEFVEGGLSEKTFLVSELKPVKDIIKEYKQGLQSSMSYVGVKTLNEYKGQVEFIQVSPFTVKENGLR